MIRGKFKYNPDTGKMEDYIEPPKPEVNAPTFFKDEILDGLHSMADDKIYYSRSAYLRSLKEQGYEVTGGEHLKDVKPWTPPTYEQVREDTVKAYYDVKYDRVEFTEQQKELHKREEEKWNNMK